MARKSRVEKGCDAFVCNWTCAGRVARPIDGRIRSLVFDACGSFWGLRHVWADAESIESGERAREILAAGLAHLAARKAMKHD